MTVLVAAGFFVLVVVVGIAGATTETLVPLAHVHVSAALVLFGVATAAVALHHLVADTSWRARSERVQATVTHAWTTIRRVYVRHDEPIGLTHPFVVAFVLPDGRRFHTRAPEVSTFFRPQRGQEVTILYDATTEPIPRRGTVALPVPQARDAHRCRRGSHRRGGVPGGDHGPDDTAAVR